MPRGTTPLRRDTPLRRRAELKRAPFSPASPAQRAKVRGQRCVHCGRPATDPMHVWKRGRGGCDDPLCVVPGCRRCHRAFDRGELDLLGDLVKRYKPEIAHALMHADPVSLLARLTGCEVVLRRRPRRPFRQTLLAGTETPDPSHATVYAWPWLSIEALPPDARSALEAHGIAELLREGTRTETLEVSLLAGDEESGEILEISDHAAEHGRAAYHELIERLHAGGLNVYATNKAGFEHDAGWELHGTGTRMIERTAHEPSGHTTLTERQLLEEARRIAHDAEHLRDVPAEALRAAVLQAFAPPDVPNAVLEAAERPA